MIILAIFAAPFHFCHPAQIWRIVIFCKLPASEIFGNMEQFLPIYSHFSPFNTITSHSLQVIRK
jgi:hypothetical protein